MFTHKFIIENKTGNRNAFKLLADIYQWSEDQGIYLYLGKIHGVSPDVLNEFDIEILCDENDLSAITEWLTEQIGDAVWKFRKEAAQ